MKEEKRVVRGRGTRKKVMKVTAEKIEVDDRTDQTEKSVKKRRGKRGI